MATDQKFNPRFPGGAPKASLLLLVLALLMVQTGCGRHIKVYLERPAETPQPAWVGVYFLSNESALDGMSNIELSDPDAVPVGGEVIYKEVYPLHPGGDINRIVLDDYNPEIRWVVVAAGIPDDPLCARHKVPVQEGAKLKLIVTVNEKCIDLKID
jgi:hypothetical protein